MNSRITHFVLNGFGETQQVTATWLRQADPVLSFILRFDVHHLQFNMADGEPEEDFRFSEEWELIRTAGPNGENCFNILAIRSAKAGEGWQARNYSRLLEPYSINLTLGPFLPVLEIEPDSGTLCVHSVKNPDYTPPDHHNSILENKKAGWNMSFLKSGENPDDNPFPEE